MFLDISDHPTSLTQEVSDVIARKALRFTQKCYIPRRYTDGPAPTQFIRILEKIVTLLYRSIKNTQERLDNAQGLRNQPSLSATTTPQDLIARYQNASAGSAPEYLDQIFAYALNYSSKVVRKVFLEDVISLRDFTVTYLEKLKSEISEVCMIRDMSEKR